MNSSCESRIFSFQFKKLFLLFIVLPFIVQAQQQKVDSLQALLKNAQHDTTRLSLQNEIGLAYYNFLSDSALSCWKRSYEFAEEKKVNHSGKALQRLLTIEGEMLSDIGFIYTERGMPIPALEYNFKSLHLRDSINDLHGIAESMNNIAFIYRQQHDTLHALEYYGLSGEKYKAINDIGGVAYTMINRGQIYMSRKEDTRALDMYSQALKILEKMPDNHRGYSSALNNIGNIYMRLGRYDEAGKYMRSGLAIRKKNNDRLNMAASYTSLSNFFQKTGMLDSALYYAMQGHALALETKNSQAAITSALLLSDLYKARGDFQQAFQYYKEYIDARKIVDNEEAGKEMVRQQMGYEYAQKSAVLIKDKELGEIKLSRQRGYTIGGFSALAIVGVLLFFVYRQRNGIAREKKRSDELLLNILPSETAEELKTTGAAKTKSYDNVTVMFTDFKNFTQTAELLSAEKLVALINVCYGEFDRIVSKYNVEKIKTIGDSYMCAGGLPLVNETHATDTLNAAIEMLSFIRGFNEERIQNKLPFFDIRIGLHTGPVVAGIVGTKKFAYDIWGDAVNIASRMESSGEPGRINISGTTYERVKGKFNCEYRGKVSAKNKGEIDMYFVITPMEKSAGQEQMSRSAFN